MLVVFILTEWRRRKGRLKQRWMDNVYQGLKCKTGLCGGKLSETSTSLRRRKKCRIKYFLKTDKITECNFFVE